MSESFAEVENVLKEQLTDEEKQKLDVACTRHGLTYDHPVMLVIAETLILQREKAFQPIQEQIEQVTQSIDALTNVVQETRQPQKKHGGQWREYLPLSLCILASWVFIAALAAAVTNSTLLLHQQQVAALTDTRAGQSVMHLLQANGDQLPAALDHCTRYSAQHRIAMKCTLWDSGQPPLHENLLLMMSTGIQSLPVWLFATIAMLSIAGNIFFCLRTQRRIRMR